MRQLPESRDYSSLQEKNMNLAASPDIGELTHDNQTEKKWICRPECHVIIKGVSTARTDFSTKAVNTFTNGNQFIHPQVS